MPDVKGLLSDPQFQQLDLSTQKSTLGKLDSQFSTISDGDYLKFRDGMKGSLTKPAHTRRGTLTGREPGETHTVPEQLGNMVSGTLGVAEPGLEAGAILGAGQLGMTGAAALRAGGMKAAGKVAVKAARDLATAYVAGEGVSRGLKAIGVNGVLANIGGLLAGMGAAGTLEEVLGKDTIEKLSAKVWEEKYGSAPKTALEKLKARGEAQAEIANARNAAKTPKAKPAPAQAQAPAPKATPAAPAVTHPVKPTTASATPAGAEPAKPNGSYAFTHPKESVTDIRKQLFSNAQQAAMPNLTVRENFKKLFGHGISGAEYDELFEFNEFIAKNGRLPSSKDELK